MGWSHTSRWKNTAAERASTFCLSNSFQPLAPICSVLAVAFPPKGLSSSSSCSWKPKHGPVFPRDSACPAARVWRCQQTWAGSGVPVCCRWQRCHKQGHPLCPLVHGASWCHAEMALLATMIKRHLGGGAGKLLSMRVILGMGISPFSFHFPPAAKGVGRSRDARSCMRKIPLAEADEPA